MTRKLGVKNAQVKGHATDVVEGLVRADEGHDETDGADIGRDQMLLGAILLGGSWLFRPLVNRFHGCCGEMVMGASSGSARLLPFTRVARVLPVVLWAMAQMYGLAWMAASSGRVGSSWGLLACRVLANQLKSVLGACPAVPGAQ